MSCNFFMCHLINDYVCTVAGFNLLYVIMVEENIIMEMKEHSENNDIHRLRVIEEFKNGK